MSGIETWAIFGFGFVAGAAFVGERPWAFWLLCIITLLGAFTNAVRGDWLWGATLLVCSPYWGYSALTVEQRLAGR